MNSFVPTLSDVQLDGVEPASDDLWDLLRQRVDDAMLREIAAADYAADVDAHMEMLRRIRDTGELPAPIEWIPKEVLELTRWSEPDQPDSKPECAGTRGHTQRAFACAALLRAATEPANHGYFDGENSTLAQLLDSALMLGADVQEATLRFLVWRVTRLPLGEERPFFSFGILFLAAHLGGPRFPEDCLARLADWVVAEEAREREFLGKFLPPNGEQWLLGLTFYSLKHDVWRRLARHLVAQASQLPTQEVRNQLTGLALRIADASDEYEQAHDEALRQMSENVRQGIDEKGAAWFIRDLHSRLQAAGVENSELDALASQLERTDKRTRYWHYAGILAGSVLVVAISVLMIYLHRLDGWFRAASISMALAIVIGWRIHRRRDCAASGKG